MKHEMVTIKVLSGFLANTTEKTHRAQKSTEDGATVYEVRYGGCRVVLPAHMVKEIAPVETFWFVKKVTTATDKNKNFPGEVHTYIFGKEEFRLFEDVPNGFFNRDLTNCPHVILENGYKRACDAKRSYEYKHPEDGEYWTSKVSLVCCEIQKGEDGNYHMA